MKRSHSVTAALLLLCVVLLAACAQEAQESIGSAKVYVLSHVDDAKTMVGLVPDYLDIPEEADISQQCESVIVYVKNPGGDNKFSYLPSRADITYSIGGSVAYIDLGEEFYDLQYTRRTLTGAAFVLSLLEVPGVTYVYLTADNKPVEPFTGYISASTFIIDDALYME